MFVCQGQGRAGCTGNVLERCAIVRANLPLVCDWLDSNKKCSKRYCGIDIYSSRGRGGVRRDNWG